MAAVNPQQRAVCPSFHGFRSNDFRYATFRHEPIFLIVHIYICMYRRKHVYMFVYLYIMYQFCTLITLDECWNNVADFNGNKALSVWIPKYFSNFCISLTLRKLLHWRMRVSAMRAFSCHQTLVSMTAAFAVACRADSWLQRMQHELRCVWHFYENFNSFQFHCLFMYNNGYHNNNKKKVNLMNDFSMSGTNVFISFISKITAVLIVDLPRDILRHKRNIKE